ncbi:uncharacterized protein METZ01_LOCUS147400 [marine metagenome]|uniref:Uncharacterized protein n=1 Tax=marine metagenome TaxID=408172 RepID=A0A381ZZ48_9ZZZZ
MGLFTAAFARLANQPTQALLLPKLRSHFAEFLSESSLERLRIFSLPTCVGLRYAHHHLSSRSSFLGKQPNQFSP